MSIPIVRRAVVVAVAVILVACGEPAPPPVTAPPPLAFRFEGDRMVSNEGTCSLALSGPTLRLIDCPDGATLAIGTASATSAGGLATLPTPEEGVLDPTLDLDALVGDTVPVELFSASVRTPTSPSGWTGRVVAVGPAARRVVRAALHRYAIAQLPSSSGHATLAMLSSGFDITFRNFGGSRWADVSQVVLIDEAPRALSDCGRYRGADGVEVTITRQALDLRAEVYRVGTSTAVAEQRFAGAAPECPTSLTASIFGRVLQGEAPTAEAWAWVETLR